MFWDRSDRLPQWAALALLAFAVIGGDAVAQVAEIAPGPSDEMTFASSGFPSPIFLDMFSLGDLPFDLQFSFNQGYDDNIFAASIDPIGSLFSSLSAGILYELSQPRWSVMANVGASMTYYYSRPDDKDDLNWNITIGGSYKFSPRLSLEGTSNTLFLSQPDINIEGSNASNVGNYYYSLNELKLSYVLRPRVSLVSAWRMVILYYDDQNYNDLQGRIEQTFTQSIRYTHWPQTTFVGEYRFNPVTYFEADLDNYGNFLLLGWDHLFNPRLKWDFRFGVEQRIDNNAVDGRSGYLGPFVSSSLRYQYRPSSSFTWNLRYGTEPSGQGLVTIRETFRTSLLFSHAFTPRLMGTISFTYTHSNYDQPGVIPDYSQDIFGSGIGLVFAVTRNFSVQANYNYTQVVSPTYWFQEYSRNVFSVGAGVTF